MRAVFSIPGRADRISASRGRPLSAFGKISTQAHRAARSYPFDRSATRSETSLHEATLRCPSPPLPQSSQPPTSPPGSSLPYPAPRPLTRQPPKKFRISLARRQRKARTVRAGARAGGQCVCNRENVLRTLQIIRYVLPQAPTSPDESIRTPPPVRLLSIYESGPTRGGRPTSCSSVLRSSESTLTVSSTRSEVKNLIGQNGKNFSTCS
ncbi:hypothetical protein NUW54_g9845 [Trametes sanguinea]|uniref:Uncharacterized protein n=1 Tax=Trametes sanguinea TaxID=158606 RepID=A0ACC1P3P2_9APHY|nr:hypothetical protein NUW54_g9845 [Trametes sanguinea]